ncbi:MAG TPA: AAC(3) family N-acetyltransferase [Armatimonadota bacterium]|nr:AAC(3) family N-acetyltransferase [Armatimonadota bacterium]
MAASVTNTDIVDGLGRLGISSGDLVFAHASLSRLGWVEGGPDGLIDALLAAVGETGTLAMPGFTFQLNELADPVFDVRHAPTWASKVYERFRTREGTLRSHHASHSVCAVGARAEELVSEHSPRPCLRPSPFGKLVDWGGTIVLIGVDQNCNTTFHLVEESEGVFYSRYTHVPDAMMIDETGELGPLDLHRHHMTRTYDFNRMDEPLRQAGIQRETVIGNAIVRCLDAKRMYDFTVEAVHEDEEALLQQGDERTQVSVSP